MSKTVCGTLNDTEIKNAVKSGELIIGDFNPDNVKQTCYELRAGNIYFDLSAGGTRHEIKDDGIILFRPHQTIVVISKEKFSLPNNILARFLTKGSLFSIGFAPVNTYADPGFYGHMGIVMNNTSNNYLKIPCGAAIAKAEFDRLQNPVSVPYHGQHGFETGVWPMRSDYIIDRKQLSQYLPKYNELQEIKAIYGESVAEIIRRILITERRFVFATIILIVINMIIIGLSTGTDWLSPITNVILGIVTNVLYALVSLFVTHSKWRKSGQ